MCVCVCVCVCVYIAGWDVCVGLVGSVWVGGSVGGCVGGRVFA